MAICGLGFVLLGTLICMMLEEPGWTIRDALATGMRLGGPLGALLGAIAGGLIGCFTAAAGAAKKFFTVDSGAP